MTKNGIQLQYDELIKLLYEFLSIDLSPTRKSIQKINNSKKTTRNLIVQTHNFWHNSVMEAFIY